MPVDKLQQRFQPLPGHPDAAKGDIGANDRFGDLIECDDDHNDGDQDPVLLKNFFQW